MVLTDDILSDGIYYPLEGYLAPETYFLTQEDTIESITKNDVRSNTKTSRKI